ncbi:MAG TPA: MFS transporter [Bacilli bacterium]|nr:MFS transporter [Bacilli bacterium]
MIKLIRRNKAFGKLLAASMISEMGSHFTYMLLIVLAYEETKSVMTTMGITIASSVGTLLMGSVSGVLVDRRRPVQVMVLSNLLQALAISSLFFLPVSTWSYYVMSFIMAVLATFQAPASRKYQVTVVQEDELMEANASMQTGREALKIIGPLLAVTVLSVFAPEWRKIGYLIDGTSFILCALILTSLGFSWKKQEAEKEASSAEKSRFVEQWREGFAPLKQPILAAVVLMFLFIIIGIGGVEVIFTAHVSEAGYSSLAVGYLFAALSAGLILASMFGTKYFAKWPLAIRLGGATLGIGLFMGAVGLNANLIAMSAASFVLGLFNSVYNVSASTYMQKAVPREQLGRFFGLVSSLFSAVGLLGLAINGVLGTILEPHLVLLWVGGILSVTGCVSMVVIGLAERKTRAANQSASA